MIYKRPLMRPTRLNANDVGIVVLVMERVNAAMGLLHVVKCMVSVALFFPLSMVV